MAKRRRRNRKWLKRGLIFALVIAAGVISYLVYDAYFKEPAPAPIPEAPETPVVEDAEVDEGYGEVVEEEAVVEEKEEVVQYEGENPNDNAGLTGVMTFTSVTNGVLRVRVNIDQYATGGTCTLNLIQNGKSIYNMVVPTIDSAATATCEGFDVATEGLPKGATKIVIKITAGGKSGEISGALNL